LPIWFSTRKSELLKSGFELGEFPFHELRALVLGVYATQTIIKFASAYLSVSTYVIVAFLRYEITLHLFDARHYKGMAA
jgi:hypothetical protein